MPRHYWPIYLGTMFLIVASMLTDQPDRQVLAQQIAPPYVAPLISACTGTDKVKAVNSNATLTCEADSGGGLDSGLIVITLTSCPSGFTEETTLSTKFVLGTLAANADVGTTGGNDNITPAGTNSTSTAAAQTFTGDASTAVVNHVHLETAPTGQTGGQDSFTRDTSTTGSSNTALSTANPTGGVASYTPTGTNSSSSVTAQTFTGTSFDNRAAFVKVIFCKKT